MKEGGREGRRESLKIELKLAVKYHQMTEAISRPVQSEYPLEAFCDAHYDPQGVCGSYAYPHQIQPANETWIICIAAKEIVTLEEPPVHGLQN